MKLVCYPFGPISILPGKVTLLQTNNRNLYTTFISFIRDKSDDIKIFEDEKELNVSSHVEWLGDPFLNINLDTKLKSKIQSNLIKSFSADTNRNLFEVQSKLKSLILDEAFKMDLPLIVGIEWNIEKLVKYIDVKIDTNIASTPYDIIETVLKTFSEIHEHKLIVLTNTFDYLDVSQFNELVRIVKRLDSQILLVDFSESDKFDTYQNSDFYYIDNDFVEWHF